MTAARTTSLGDLLTVLGSTGLTLASSPTGRNLAAARTALHDPFLEPVDTKAGMLLVPGVAPDAPQAPRVVETAAAKGFNAVVVKAYGRDVETLARAADRVGVALLVVHDEVDWLHLDSLLHHALGTAAQVGGSPPSPALGDLFALAGAIADAVGGATAIEDRSRRVLAYSSSPAQPIDDDRREGILGRKVPDLPENDEQYRALDEAPGVLRFPAAPPAMPRMAVAVRAGQEVLGSIWVVDAQEQLGQNAEQALLGAAPIVALHLLRARSAEELARRQRGNLVRRVLEGVARPWQAAEALGLERNGPFAVLAFADADPARGTTEAAGTRLLDLVTVYCEARVGATGAALLDGTTYVLAAGSRLGDDQPLAALATEVVAAATGSLNLELVAAVSTVVDDLEVVTEARDEADRMISLLRHRRAFGPVATATRLADQLALAGLGDTLTSRRRLRSRVAESMARHDTENGTEYQTSVLAYLDTLRDVGAAAARLAMHPNTLRYRLRRARDMFGLDLDDPDQVLLLWLSLRCLDAPAHRKPGRREGQA